MNLHDLTAAAESRFIAVDGHFTVEAINARHEKRLAEINGYRNVPAEVFERYLSNAKSDHERLLSYRAERLAAVAHLRSNPALAEVAISADKKALRSLPLETLHAASYVLSEVNYFNGALLDGAQIRAAASAIYGECRRRRSNESREKNTEKREAAVLGLAEKFPVGSRCEVHAFGHWYGAEVVRHASKGGKVEVRYTSGTGKVRCKLVGSDLVRAAQ